MRYLMGAACAAAMVCAWARGAEAYNFGFGASFGYGNAVPGASNIYIQGNNGLSAIIGVDYSDYSLTLTPGVFDGVNGTYVDLGLNYSGRGDTAYLAYTGFASDESTSGVNDTYTDFTSIGGNIVIGSHHFFDGTYSFGQDVFTLSSLTVSFVPLPAAAPLLVTGLLTLGGIGLFRRRRAQAYE